MVDIHQPIVIDGVTVVLIDAFHCPGSVMFLFILPDGKRILHTGDFRASPEMEKNNFLTEKPIDHIYLDTTYCHPDYNFPKQGETLQMVIDLTLEYLAKEPKLLIVCGAYTIGKEKVFKCLCETLCMNLWVPSSKLQVLLSMNDPVIQQHLVLDKDDAQIHVLPMTDINHEFLRGYLRGCRDRFTSILAFKPSGWQNNEDSSSAIVPAIQDNVYIYGIPYSEHSSYSELERFIKFFKPRMITPTVFHSDSKFRVMMLRSIAQWKSTYLQNGDQQSSA
ncbi:DNA cross-link repair 1A protein-like isoform X2 [Tetranychus urticae]|nr:DNA cross-link repair 1A protein-like isoform X2 [Tetranychus urticae]